MKTEVKCGHEYKPYCVAAAVVVVVFLVNFILATGARVAFHSFIINILMAILNDIDGATWIYNKIHFT